MRFYWNHIWKSRRYRSASAEERRLIEIRFCLATSLAARRGRLRVTQAELARRLGLAQSTISRAERASNLVSLDVAVRALIALECTDAELLVAFDVASNAGVKRLRERAGAKFFPPPRGGSEPEPAGEHRFLRKGSGPFPRLR